MALPKGIFESFQENPGTDLDDTSGLSVLDTMNENSPMAKILAKNRKVMQTEAMAIPEQNNAIEKGDGYGGQAQSKPQQRKQVVNEEFYNENDEREIPQPSMEDLLAKVRGGANRLVEQKPAQQPVYIQPTYNPSPVQQSVGIDYALLNTMIKGAVTEAMSGFKNQLLIESKSNVSEAAFMTIGKEIRIVDKNGNIYAGKLQKIANTNDLD